MAYVLVEGWFDYFGMADFTIFLLAEGLPNYENVAFVVILGGFSL